MKTRCPVLPFLLLLAAPAAVQAQDAYSTNADGSIYTYSTNADGSANIVHYAGPPWVVTIPTNINGLTVTSIGTNAFEYDSLTNVTIANTVTSIGSAAFGFCSGLNNVTIPESVTSIEVRAFEVCTNLTSVTIPNSVTSIGEGVSNGSDENAFLGCTRLTAITVDTNNPAYSSLNGVLFDKSQTTLIQYPGGLGGSYTIPNSVTSIGDDAFGGTLLKSVTIPNSVTSIGYEAFAGTRLTSVTIPSSVNSIGDLAFYGCPSLTNATIGSGVTSIGDEAFGDCTSLTSVTIPGSVTSIGEYAFWSDYSLTSVYFTGNAPSTYDSTVFSEANGTVYYLPGTTGWGAKFGFLPTAPWFLPNPQILNFEPGFGVQPGGFGFTISWATNASVVVEAATNLANPVWLPVSTNTLTGGTNYFSDPQWTNYPRRFYRAVGAYTVGGMLTGLPAGDTVTLQDNGSDNLTLNTNGAFTFPTALPDGHAYSITVRGIFFGGLTATTCTLTNGRGTISGANVTNVAAQCAYNPETCPVLTGNPDVDMLNAAVSDGTANGGVTGVMYTENGGPFLVTAIGPCTHRVALFYPDWAVFTQVVGTYSCSSTTFTNGTPVIQFGTSLACQPDDLYGY